MPLATIDAAIEDIRRGKFVIVVDDDDRENEGDMIMAAEFVTPAAVNFLAHHACGLICVPMTGDRLDELQLPPMVQNNRSKLGTAFTVSVEARIGTTTGISAADRARTIAVLADPKSRPEDLVSPGHIFPLRAANGGVLQRAGHTEAAVDLARLAGCAPVGVLCEVMNEDGTMARRPDLERIAARHDLKIISIADLIEYRRRHEILVRRVTETRLPTGWGEFLAIAYENVVTGEQHVALVKGDVADGEPMLVRVHSECLTGDVFGSKRCDCGEQLDRAMAMVAQAGRGVILYMRQEGRGIGLHNKLRAYALQDQGLDTVEANQRLGFPPDLREYGIGAQILADLGLRKLRLLTNNPRKVVGLEGHGLEVVEQIPIRIAPNPVNARYLETKRVKLGHTL